MLLNEILNPGSGYFCKDLLRSSQRLTKQSSLNKFLSCVLELEKKTLMLMIACILVTRCRERSCHCFGNFFFYGYLSNSQKVLFRLPMGNIGLLHLWALLTETPVYQVRCVHLCSRSMTVCEWPSALWLNLRIPPLEIIQACYYTLGSKSMPAKIKLPVCL